MIPSDHQSTAEPAITALDDIDDLVAGQGSEQQASPTDATVATACASIQQPLTNSEHAMIATIDENCFPG